MCPLWLVNSTGHISLYVRLLNSKVWFGCIRRLHSLYVLFSQVTPRDIFKGTWPFVLWIQRSLKETILLSSMTWSELRRQNIQAEEVYSWQKNCKIVRFMQFWSLSILSVKQMFLTTQSHPCGNHWKDLLFRICHVSIINQFTQQWVSSKQSHENVFQTV